MMRQLMLDAMESAGLKISRELPRENADGVTLAERNRGIWYVGNVNSYREARPAFAGMPKTQSGTMEFTFPVSATFSGNTDDTAKIERDIDTLSMIFGQCKRDGTPFFANVVDSTVSVTDSFSGDALSVEVELEMTREIRG